MSLNKFSENSIKKWMKIGCGEITTDNLKLNTSNGQIDMTPPNTGTNGQALLSNGNGSVYWGDNAANPFNQQLNTNDEVDFQTVQCTGFIRAQGPLIGMTETGDLNLVPSTIGNAGDLLTSTGGGTVSFLPPSNIFDQDLNTTDSVQFQNVSTTENQNIGPDWRIVQEGDHLVVKKHNGDLQFFSFRQGGYTNQHGGNGSTGIEYRSSQGTISTPLPTNIGDPITQLLFNGYNGDDYKQVSAIKTEALENFTPTQTGSKLQFFVTPIATTDMQNVMELDSSIRVSIPFISSDTTQSTSTLSGSIVTHGGIGIAKNINVGQNINFNGLINGTTNGGGYFAQVQSITNTNSTVETSMIGAGQGTLTIPSNTFPIGGSYTIFCGGSISCLNNSVLDIKVYGGLGGLTLLESIPTMTIGTTTSKWWGLNIYLTVRAIGPAGVASISARAVYNQNVDAGNNLFGNSFHTINNTTFDTTLDNTLRITATWGSASPSNSITMAQCVLTKSY